MIKVHEIGSYMVRNYILETLQGFIVIDTGYSGGMERFEQRFKAIAPLSQIRFVFLTHAHDDHAGFLKDLLAVTSAPVVLHPDAIPVLQHGETPILPGAGYASKLASAMGIFKKSFLFPPIDVSNRCVVAAPGQPQVFKDLGLPLRILFLPGHTACSIGLLNEEDGSLYCGDAAMNALISPKRHTVWINDAVAFGNSWDVMLKAKPARIVPSHGNPFSPKDLIRYRHYLEGRQLIPVAKKEGQ